MEWAAVQDSYFKWLGIRKTGKRWVTELITKLWDVAWDQWECRNKFIHNTQLAADLSGAASLDEAIKVEVTLGYQGLPPQVSRIFPRDVERLLNASLFEMKCLFVLVGASRELINDCCIHDEFSDPLSHLRKWVGLKSQ